MSDARLHGAVAGQSRAGLEIWLVEADVEGMAMILGVFTSVRKAANAADAAEASGFRGVTCTPYVANQRLWPQYPKASLPSAPPAGQAAPGLTQGVIDVSSVVPPNGTRSCAVNAATRNTHKEESDRAFIAARLANIKHGQWGEKAGNGRESCPEDKSLISLAEAAKTMEVSAPSVSRAEEEAR